MEGEKKPRLGCEYWSREDGCCGFGFGRDLEPRFGARAKDTAAICLGLGLGWLKVACVVGDRVQGRGSMEEIVNTGKEQGISNSERRKCRRDYVVCSPQEGPSGREKQVQGSKW